MGAESARSRKIHEKWERMASLNLSAAGTTNWGFFLKNTHGVKRLMIILYKKTIVMLSLFGMARLF